MLLHFNNKKGISVAALSVAAIVIITLASVITVSLVGNYNESKKIEFAQELNMIKLVVDNYYYENGTYPVTDKQLTLSNLSNEIKQSQFFEEVEVDGQYIFNVLDLNLVNINSLKYGTGKDGLYDAYVVSNNTGNIYYAKGLKIGNKTYYTLNNELNGLLTGNNNLEINSDKAVLFTQQKLNNGNISVKISVPKNYEINSVKFENDDINLDSEDDNYYIYYLQTDESGTIDVSYNANDASKNAKYTIADNDIVENEEDLTLNIYISLSNELPTQGPINATITASNSIPTGYKIQYKIDEGEWTDGSKITNITENCKISCRVYSSGLGRVIAQNSKEVNNIDNIKPIIASVDGNAQDWINANVILTVNGAVDNESGLHDTEAYSFDDGLTWQTSNSNHRHLNIIQNHIIYCRWIKRSIYCSNRRIVRCVCSRIITI